MIRLKRKVKKQAPAKENRYFQNEWEEPCPAVVCEGINCFTRKTAALQNVSLQIQSGDLFVILGLSGSGKTTLLRSIAGLETQCTGCIALNGQTALDTPNHIFVEAAARNVRMIFKENTLRPHLNVGRNVASAIQSRGKASAQNADKAMRFLGIEALHEKVPSQLTPLQRLQTALARSLVSGAPLLLLDDALQTICPEEHAAARETLRRFWKMSGITVFLATADREDAMTLAKQLAILDGGRILQVGAPSEIYRNPACIRAAQIVCGDTYNFVRGKAQLQEELLTVQSDLGIWQYSSAMLTPEARPSKLFDCIVGVRAECIRMCAEWEETAVEVKIVPGMFSNMLTARLRGQNLSILRRPEWELENKERIYINANATQANIFDANTGRLIKRAVMPQTSPSQNEKEAGIK
ncbi:MAG: ABC transporter ATP-binding protein [Clostridiales bacterium]|nr:ABC transporter ATP-binding protein [Clostridiales bacterium]